MYSRIDLSKTNYDLMPNAERLEPVPVRAVLDIYKDYCLYKEFTSCMPIFPNELTRSNTDVIGYFTNGKLVAFSMIDIMDADNIENMQFAWNYEQPRLRLGIESMKHECAYYKELGYKYLYMGGDEDYKSEIDGFELSWGISWLV